MSQDTDALREAVKEMFPAGKAAEIRPTVIWAIKQWRHKFTPEELADAILSAPPVAAALAARTGSETAAVTLLREVEWVYPAYRGDSYCPICEEPKNSGHAPDCRLTAALSTAPAPERRERLMVTPELVAVYDEVWDEAGELSAKNAADVRLAALTAFLAAALRTTTAPTEGERP